jgi:exosortase
MPQSEKGVVGKKDVVLLVLATVGILGINWSIVPKMVVDWWDDPNFSHGLLVPLFTGYLLWERREELNLSPGNGNIAPGLGPWLVLLGLAMVVVGKAGGEFFTMRSSLVVVVMGFFRILFGKDAFRKCLFPLGFLFFMVPIPYILYDAVAFPLKMLASWIGEHSLNAIGVPVFREGNVIFLPNLQLEVADACSGIRSLMSLMAMATATAYFMGIGLVSGTVLFLSAIPISLLTNSARIVLTGILSYRIGRPAAEGFFHDFSGWLIFLAGGVLVVGFGLILRKARPRREPPADR